MLDQNPPALWAPTPGPAAPRNLCTDCGLSRMKIAGKCGQACQFIQPEYPKLERQVYGKARDPDNADEHSFSVQSAGFTAQHYAIRNRAHNGPG